ncbi:Fic family protein [Paraburkholderia aspalathi]|nr:Fic family protein [Paraburkholderia aspalathi]
MYIWEKPLWPAFRWDAERLIEPISAARFSQGRFLSSMENIGFDAQLQTELIAMSSDVIKSSAIEGEVLNPASVRSSIARRLGLDEGGLVPSDRKVDGIVEMMLDATRNFKSPLTRERLFGWHAALFPTGYSGLTRIDVGTWRNDAHGPMQVVSMSQRHQRVHYEAPPAPNVAGEMEAFLKWFNEDSQNCNGIIRAGIAHLWFVSIHPLDDGNGRSARAVADLAISQMEGTGQRFYSMSTQIEREKKTYYALLEETQKGDLGITDWLVWFSKCYHSSILEAEKATEMVVAKARFFKQNAEGPRLSERQSKVLRRVLDGFEGNLTAKKYAAIAKCSQDTASRDINDLVSRGILLKNPGGSKNTSFSLSMPEMNDKTFPEN